MPGFKRSLLATRRNKEISPGFILGIFSVTWTSIAHQILSRTHILRYQTIAFIHLFTSWNDNLLLTSKLMPKDRERKMTLSYWEIFIFNRNFRQMKFFESDRLLWPEFDLCTIGVKRKNEHQNKTRIWKKDIWTITSLRDQRRECYH